MRAALQARPRGTPAGVPYQEIIRHPAFGSEIVNAGVFLVSAQGTLIKRQTRPRPEDLEIGVDRIVVRRDARTVTRPVPPGYAPLLSTLRAIILGRPEMLGVADDGELVTGPHGWSVVLSPLAPPGAGLELSGCGSRLLGLEFIPRNGQARLIRFTAG